MNVFLVGAGFTRAVIPDAPLNRELLEKLSSPSKGKVFSDLRDRYGTNDIEIALTRLDLDIGMRGPDADELESLRKRINDGLANYFYQFKGSETLLSKSPWLESFITNGFQRGDVAVSLNYDCVLEGLLDCRGKWSPKGGYGKSIGNPLASDGVDRETEITVLKIHGSANFVSSPYGDKPASEGIGYIFDEHSLPRSAKNTHFGGGINGRPYLIPPSYVKIPAIEIVHLMLEALEATSKADNLIVIGCSLRPEDSFLTLLRTKLFQGQARWRERRIIIVDPDAKRISEKIKRFWGVKVDDQIITLKGTLEESTDALLEKIRPSQT